MSHSDMLWSYKNAKIVQRFGLKRHKILPTSNFQMLVYKSSNVYSVVQNTNIILSTVPRCDGAIRCGYCALHRAVGGSCVGPYEWPVWQRAIHGHAVLCNPDPTASSWGERSVTSIFMHLIISNNAIFSAKSLKWGISRHVCSQYGGTHRFVA